MPTREAELDELLRLIAARVDLDHCRRVDERFRRALAWDEVDRPPLVVQPSFGVSFAMPPPWARFRIYPYSETFDDPVAMMQSQLLDLVVPGLFLRDDNPMAIRSNHGAIQIASLLGANWTLLEDNYPWVEPLVGVDRIEAVAAATAPVTPAQGVLPRSFDTLRFYRERLAAFPPCAEAVQISMPDLQGPMDTAEQLWGSSIFYAFTDTPALLERLLARVVDVMLTVIPWFRCWTRDRLDPVANTQHGYVVPGRLMLRDDSSIMLSPSMFAAHIRPHNARLVAAMGTASIHSCGRWDHLVDQMLTIPGLRGLDFGNPETMNMQAVYAACRERGVALTNLCVPRDALCSGAARRAFPTGVVFVYCTEDPDDAHQVVRDYTMN